MDRLINIDELWKELEILYDAKNGEVSWNDAILEIKKAPTIEERKTGKWVWDENGMGWNLGAWVCSECHARNDNIPPAIKYNDGYRKVGNPYMWQGSKFCPNCGARMVQEGEDNDS